MHRDFPHLLQEATRLTREGRLDAATQSIQRALSGQGAEPRDDDSVIDVQARVVPDAPVEAALAGLASPPFAPSRSAPSSSTAEPSTAERFTAEPSTAEPADALEREAGAPAPGAASGPGAFLPGRFGGTGLAGRDYRLYVPPAAGSEPLPLVVMLHGCTQDPVDFAAGTRMNERAREEGFFVLYPAQAQRANPQRCWNWFKASHQQRGRGEAAILAGMTLDVMARHAIDPSRVYVAGLSAGGAMAAILAHEYPELFAAAGVHSGLAAGAARDLPSALRAMKEGPSTLPRAGSVPVIVFHGTADATVHPANGRQVVEAVQPEGGSTISDPVAANGRRGATKKVVRDAAGRVVAEHWAVHGGPHAWSGGSPQGSYTDPQGPDATAEMLRFFRQHPRRGGAA